MSNLKLKDTNYAVLVERLASARGKSLKVGNNTEAVLIGSDVIVITYHGNTIARMYPDRLVFSNAGWGTSTTRTRLNIIADHNNIPVAFNQSNHKQILRARKRMWNGGDWSTVSEDFRQVVWYRDADTLDSKDHGGYTFAL